ncbi:MAG: GGDEF domain-containing protein [Candidatus Adiutrix sp.]|jgi:diguanylate cyclase (GGDEF)-like protein|nr:GGDEF domain-containing protein [Candidatus Adiutrix sp.]
MTSVFKTVVWVLNGAALCAGLLFLALKFLGLYTLASWPPVVAFVGTNILYILIAILFNRKIITNGELNQHVLHFGKIYLLFTLLIQYNFLLYLAQSRDVWYHAPYFLLFAVFFLDYRLTAVLTGGLIASMAVSWLTLGEAILPVRDKYFAVTLTMQIIVVLLFFATAFLLTYLLHKFLVAKSDSQISELSGLASEDGLTGAKNRRFFNEFLKMSIDLAAAQGHSVTLLMLDIDLFKRVNDTYGHAVGDEVLVELCRVCGKLLRKTDVLFRYGGEEFAILLGSADQPGGHGTATRILKAVNSKPFLTTAGEIPITVSIGGCTLPAQWNDPITRYVECADHMLYQAKNSGRNRVCYHM